MKSVRKLIALFLVLVLALSLSACGGFAGKMAKAASRMQKLQSLRMDLNIDVGLSMSLFGEALDLDMLLSGPAEVIHSPLKAKASFTMNMMEETLDTLCYLEKSGDKILTYLSPDNGKTWTKTETGASGLPETGGIDSKSLAGLAKLSSSFQEAGTETVRGSEAVVYSGTLSAADLESVLDIPTMLKSIETATGTKLDEDALDFSSVSPTPIVLCLDKKSGMLVKTSIDMTGLMQVMMPVVMDTAIKSALDAGGLGGLAGLDPGMLGLECNFSRLIVTVVFYDFDSVGEITIPPDALAAKAITA